MFTEHLVCAMCFAGPCLLTCWSLGWQATGEESQTRRGQEVCLPEATKLTGVGGACSWGRATRIPCLPALHLSGACQGTAGGLPGRCCFPPTKGQQLPLRIILLMCPTCKYAIPLGCLQPPCQIFHQVHRNQNGVMVPVLQMRD